MTGCRAGPRGAVGRDGGGGAAAQHRGKDAEPPGRAGGGRSAGSWSAGPAGGLGRDPSAPPGPAAPPGPDSSGCSFAL